MDKSAETVRILLADDHPILRDGLRKLLEVEPDLLAMDGNRQNGQANFGLTPREMEVITAVVNGYTNKDIAQSFSLSIQTVKHHLTSIFDKLGVSNRLELALFTVNHHLVGEDEPAQTTSSASSHFALGASGHGFNDALNWKRLSR